MAMVREISCDIFEAPIQVMAHCANIWCTMGAGIAKEIKERMPEAYRADLKTKKGDPAKLGTYSVAKLNQPYNSIKYVVNLYAMPIISRIERAVNYEHFYRSIEKLRDDLISKNKLDVVIGFPYKCACNNAGGSWLVIETMIYDVFEESPFSILICKDE